MPLGSEGAEAFVTYFGRDRVEELPKPLLVSEDFGSNSRTHGSDLSRSLFTRSAPLVSRR